jgi:hypothetical protein
VNDHHDVVSAGPARELKPETGDRHLKGRRMPLFGHFRPGVNATTTERITAAEGIRQKMLTPTRAPQGAG